MKRVIAASGRGLQDMINIIIVACLGLGFKPKKSLSLVMGSGAAFDRIRN